MSEKKQLTISNVENKNGLYIVEAGGQKYGTKEEGIREFVGKTAFFEVAMVDKGKYKNWYINAPLPDVPRESSTTSPTCIEKEKLMILSYAKDFAGFYSPALSQDDGLVLVEKAYAKMCEIVGIKEEEAPF